MRDFCPLFQFCLVFLEVSGWCRTTATHIHAHTHKLQHYLRFTANKMQFFLALHINSPISIMIPHRTCWRAYFFIYFPFQINNLASLHLFCISLKSHRELPGCYEPHPSVINGTSKNGWMTLLKKRAELKGDPKISHTLLYLMVCLIKLCFWAHNCWKCIQMLLNKYFAQKIE